MFTFSFPNPNDAQDSQKTGGSDSGCADEVEWLEAEKVSVSPTHLKCLSISSEVLEAIQINNLKVSYVPVETALEMIKSHSHDSSAVQFAEALHSDLIPGKYEGGLKVWECTIDLLEWFFKESQTDYLRGKHVLDLGCGAGLLGISALKFGSSVVFQDYNREVIEACTIPNVLFNLSKKECDDLERSSKSLEERCEFFCGDWLSFSSLIGNSEDENSKFDLIFTSETIYNPDNNLKLYHTFRKCLKKCGVVYVAAKTYYFGVGGSLRAFEAMIEADGLMKSEVCWRCSSGVQREILKITFAKDR